MNSRDDPVEFAANSVANSAANSAVNFAADFSAITAENAALKRQLEVLQAALLAAEAHPPSASSPAV